METLIMNETGKLVRLGARGSALARWQAEHVARLLRAAWPNLAYEVVVLQTQGDRVLDTPLPLLGGKGVFTAELEAALRAGEIDLAVHSLKDLPTEMPAGLALGAVPVRAEAADVLVSRCGYTLDTLPQGATVGTSSRRRAAQLLHHRRDLLALDVRGNVDTRLRKVLDADGPYDALLLAHAGLARLGRTDIITQVLPLDIMLPAPGQGALGIQCRDDAAIQELVAPLNDLATRQAVTAERAFLVGLGGGCALPIAAFAEVEDGRLRVRGRVTAVDGDRQIDARLDGPAASAAELGARLAGLALAQGAAEMLGGEAM
jgi:hydroxymethylbilane synthase